MKPYPRNNIDYVIPTPEYTNQSINMNSRYSTYRIITNLPFNVLEVKLRNLITTNKSFRGYYYTTSQPETLYQIAKKYYNNENYYWIIAMTNNLKNDKLTVVEPQTTVIIPALTELTNTNGYFSSNS